MTPRFFGLNNFRWKRLHERANLGGLGASPSGCVQVEARWRHQDWAAGLASRQLRFKGEVCAGESNLETSVDE